MTGRVPISTAGIEWDESKACVGQSCVDNRGKLQWNADGHSYLGLWKLLEGKLTRHRGERAR